MSAPDEDQLGASPTVPAGMGTDWQGAAGKRHRSMSRPVVVMLRPMPDTTATVLPPGCGASQVEPTNEDVSATGCALPNSRLYNVSPSSSFEPQNAVSCQTQSTPP